MIRKLGVGVLVAAWLIAPAAADVEIRIDAKDPVAGLPAVSADGTQFLRAIRIWRKRCKKADISVEWGGIDPSVSEPEYSSAPLVGGCGEAADAYAGNVAVVNETMRNTQCVSAPVHDKQARVLPADFEADGLRVLVTATPETAHVQINKLQRTAGGWTGGRRVVLGGKPSALHGWYVAEQDGERQLALLITALETDGTIREHWVEVWLRKVVSKPSAEDVARDWMLALADGDAAMLASLTATGFERIGLEPATGELAASCPTLRVARKKAQLGPVLDCAIAGAAARYTLLFDEDELTRIKAKQIPVGLKASKARLGKLAGKGHTLVQLHVEQDGWYVDVVLAVKGGKVAGAFEAARPL